jgi:hypothetical protein
VLSASSRPCSATSRQSNRGDELPEGSTESWGASGRELQSRPSGRSIAPARVCGW